jgi:hypothetical protein
VANLHDHSLSILDLDTLQEVRRLSYGAEPLPPVLARGRNLFNDADSPRMSRNQWITCSNCHPDGGSDGRVWSLPGRAPQLRTKDLRGVGFTLPAGWHGDRDELQDEELFIRGFHQGTGLADRAPAAARGSPNAGLAADLDALAAYLASLRPRLSPFSQDPRRATEIAEGRRLFFSAEIGCVLCHRPPWFASASKSAREAAVSTSEPGSAPLDVPSLLGVFAQRRLGHDGGANSVLDVLRSPHHPWTGPRLLASPRELSAIAAYVLALPDESVCRAIGGCSEDLCPANPRSGEL